MSRLALVLVFFAGCGGASAATRMADQDEVLLCMRNELAIRTRPGTSDEEDAAALAAERARCDAARRQIARGQ